MQQGADERSSFPTGAIKMSMETQLGWILINIIASGIIFYSLGYSTGRKDGYIKGRSAGMRIGADRRVNHG